ncbi:GNAT family N-acetyltransferase [Candidatus Puniceispirillum marinum]|uniref:GCN5-related N-acetyltransferase n=1 Tax=Puniceispirillum marinum (strain IMCC1322) TaxID=488538 RepID=D5BQV4_PUNMI|nr:GNAT family N-acetyltransferase [Candidatus Puniceispirillum marinum]ADE38668.1 GCN5-related N-acetyltransferase [Candidatus Puniceispirillum marinum IMCC1322]
MTIELQHFYDVPEHVLNPLRDKLRTFNEAALNSGINKQFFVTATNADNLEIGSIYARIRYDWLYIHMLWVDETCRGQGVGTLLINAVEDEARALGIRRSRLSTADFSPGLTLYQKLGYQIFAEIPISSFDCIESDNHSEYLMWKLSL